MKYARDWLIFLGFVTALWAWQRFGQSKWVEVRYSIPE